MLSHQGLMTKRSSKTNFAMWKSSFLGSRTSVSEEMNKVTFRTITKVEIEYRLIHFVMMMTSIVETLSMS